MDRSPAADPDREDHADVLGASAEDLADAALIADRWAGLRADVDRRGGRQVRIIAVSKRHSIASIRAALAAGINEFGENYVQELVGKASALQGAAISWHMIGQLQTRKVRQLEPIRPTVHTIDRDRVAVEVATRMPGASVLVQLNLSGLDGRGGCAPSDTERVVAVAKGAGLNVVGLMGVASPGDDAKVAGEFRSLVEMADRLGVVERCIGMSGDYPLALDCGATMIRVGTAIFGGRPPVEIDTSRRASTEHH